MNISELERQRPKLAVIAVAIAVTLGSNAQQPQEPTRENANRSQTEQQVARSDSAMQTLEQYLQTKSMRVSKLAGMELQTRSGDNLGEVHDVIPATAPGQEMQAIVQIGAIGADEKLISVPFDEIQISSDGDELYTNRTREQLAAAPGIQLDGRAATPAQRNAAEANRDAAQRGAAEPGAGQPRPAQPATPNAAQRSVAGSLSERRVADLVGAEVLGTGDDKVGEVDDIVISTAGADSLRAVLQVGGVAGVGEKRIAVPLSQLDVDRSDDGEPTLRVAMTLEALERLPEFEYEEQTAAL